MMLKFLLFKKDRKMKRHKTLKLRHTKEASEFIPMVAWLGLRNVIMHSLSQVSSFCKTHRWSVRNLSEDYALYLA